MFRVGVGAQESWGLRVRVRVRVPGQNLIETVNIYVKTTICVQGKPSMPLIGTN